MNVDGYYDCLLGLFDKGVEEGFIKPAARNIVISAKSARELLQKMEVLMHFYINHKLIPILFIVKTAKYVK